VHHLVEFAQALRPGPAALTGVGTPFSARCSAYIVRPSPSRVSSWTVRVIRLRTEVPLMISMAYVAMAVNRVKPTAAPKTETRRAAVETGTRSPYPSTVTVPAAK
jgi:hypothetical protein